MLFRSRPRYSAVLRDISQLGALDMRSFVTVIAGFVCSTAWAAPPCEWEVTILDGKTREVRTFKPGAATAELPLPKTKGFRSCQVSPVKEYQFKGVEATRIDFWCFTQSGDAMNIGSVASTRFGSDITTFQLLSGPVKIANTDGNTQVNAAGFTEISALCK